MRLVEPQKLLELLTIEPDHRFAVHQCHRRGPITHLHELLERGMIRSDVFHAERYTLLRKELFLPIARPSPRLRIHHHLFRHSTHPFPLSRLAGFRESRQPLLPNPSQRSRAHYTGSGRFGQRPKLLSAWTMSISALPPSCGILQALPTPSDRKLCPAGARVAAWQDQRKSGVKQ